MNRAELPAQRETIGAPAPWYVGLTKPRQERRAIENLRRQGFECEMPLFRVQLLVRGDVVWKREAMFPRYVFLRPERGAAPLDRVRSTLGMTGLVRFSGAPAAVADTVVSRLVGLADVRSENLFKSGDMVRFVEGPLAGLEGVIALADGEHRSIVLVEFLRKQLSVTVPTRMLERNS